jgi:hypothetical protein
MKKKKKIKELFELIDELYLKVNSLESEHEQLRKRMIADKNQCIMHGDEVRLMSKTMSLDNLIVKLHKIS